MSFLPSARLARSALAACLLAAPLCLAAKADDQAKKSIREAMEEDYLATNMSTAVAKLRSALEACEKSGCSKDTFTAIYGALGTVYSAGLSAHEDAVAAFKKMLEADPKAKPQSAYMTTDVQKDFDRAKSETKGGGEAPTPPAGGGSVGVLEERPWSEQATYHPVPVYVEAPRGVKVSRVVVRYKSPADSDWRELPIAKHKGGFGGLIPCAAVEKEGELVYYVTAFDSNLDRVASAGSEAEPRKVKLKAAISGRQPALPGGVPPEGCPRPVQGLSCETNDDCPGAKVCVNLACVDESSLEKPKPEEPPVDDKARKRSWLSLAFSPDLTVLSNVSDACSPKAQQDGTLACYFKGDVPYTGTPLAGDGNTLKGGVGLGSMRVLAGYDRLIGTTVTLGARVGYAFSGTPERAGGKKFMPFHAEARGAYWLGSDPFARTGVRPYLVANGGLAEVSARLTTEVLEDDGSGARKHKLDVYKTSGQFFAGAGVGVHYAVSPEAAMVIEVAGRAMLPDFAPVIAPSLGFAYGL